jgi:hypothetical protein
MREAYEDSGPGISMARSSPANPPKTCDPLIASATLSDNLGVFVIYVMWKRQPFHQTRFARYLIGLQLGAGYQSGCENKRLWQEL